MDNRVLEEYVRLQKDYAALSERVQQYLKEQMEEEHKTKRVNLLLKPSVFKKAKKAAKEQRISFNEFANRALEYYFKSRKDV
jgi:predicted HicB family RNase H-like nuclease